MPNVQWIEAGALMRGEIRRFLARQGIEYTETKGFLESVFVLHCSQEEYLYVCRVIRLARSTQ